MPRTFTPDELQSLTHVEYLNLSAEDRRAFDVSLYHLWRANYQAQATAKLSRDLDLVDASHCRGDIGA